MKVLQLIASPIQGGMEKHVAELSNGINESDIQVVVIADKSYAPYLDQNIQLIELNFKLSRRNPILLISLYMLIRKIRPDIIHCHGGKASQLIATLKPIIESKCISTVHNIKNNTNYLSKFDQIICVSNYITQSLPKEWKARTIYNGIKKPRIISQDEKNKLRKEFGVSPSEFIWIAVGRLVIAKGFNQLIKAMEQVTGTLIIIGEGTERSNLEELINSLNLRSRVILIGHRDNAQEIIQCADQLVISSLREGFSYVFLEAMLTNTPVISSDVPVPNEILPKELIYPIGSHIELAKLMKKSQENPYNLTDIMKECNRLMTIESMVNATTSLYLETSNRDNSK